MRGSKGFAGILTFWVLLGVSWALAEASGSLPLPPNLPPADTFGKAVGASDLEEKKANAEVRMGGASLERVNPRPVFRKVPPYEGGGFRFELPYVSVSRKDILLSSMADPDCSNYNLPDLLALLERPEFADFRPWQGNPAPEEKQKALEKRAQSLADGKCPDSTWNLPYSSVIATREAAGALKRAWERFEDRYFWRVVTDVNNPTYWFPFCGLGLGLDSKSVGPRPPIDFIPQGSLPPELGGLLTKEIADVVSQFKANLPWDPQKGVRESTPNYHPESSGQFRKPLYLPFVPTVPPGEFCDNLPLKIPILYIPAMSFSVCGFTVWTSPGYPDRPWLFDQGEADRRIREGVLHAYSKYYPEYLLEALAALLPLSQVGSTIGGVLNTLSSASLTDPSSVADAISRVEGLAYFPIPWQAPILGGGAVITPVYDYLYPDALRIGADILTIYDMVGVLLQGESLGLLEKGALALYYLQPVLEYMEQPLLPGIIDTPLQDTPAGKAINALYGVVREVVSAGIEGFTKGLGMAAQAAFGPDKGPIFEAGVRVLLAPFTDLLASDDPRYFVSKTLSLLVGIDHFLATFTGQGFNFQNKVNGVLVSPGVWRFEELKRVFPPSAPLTQRLFGYASFFGAWSEMRATLIPDPFARWANPMEYTLAAVSRLVGFWHVPIRVDVCVKMVAIYPDFPRYMPLAPYLLPFAGEQINWGWFNVPEGYPLPLVKGLPGGALPALGPDHPYSGKYTGAPGLIDLYEEKLLGFPKSQSKPTGGNP